MLSYFVQHWSAVQVLCWNMNTFFIAHTITDGLNHNSQVQYSFIEATKRHENGTFSGSLFTKEQFLT